MVGQCSVETLGNIFLPTSRDVYKRQVEDFTYTSEIRISTLDCSSFTNPYQMKEYAEMRLADYALSLIHISAAAAASLDGEG